MAALDALLPYLLPSVTGCSEPLALQTLRATAYDFCARTDLIQRVLVSDCVAGTQDYTITAPVDMELLRILSVSWQGQILTPVSPALVQQDIVLRGVTIGTAVPTSNSPTWYFQKTPTDSGFSLYPIPNATLASGLTVKASFGTSNTATTIDDVLFSDWADDLATGAMGTLMSMPGHMFSSREAPAYTKLFNGAVTRGRRLQANGRLPGSLRVMPQRFI